MIEWRKKVAIELRADNPNYTTVLQYDRPRWYTSDEETKIRALLQPVAPPNIAVANLHEAVVDPLYRRAQATTAYNLINFNEREEKYNFYNCKLHGLIEKACSNSIQAQVFLEKRLDDFQAAGGDMTKLNGKVLLDAIVELFNRDTIRTKGEKLKTFYTRTMSDYKRGMDLVTTLEKDSIELVRLGEFSLDSVEPKLIDRFIDAINDEPRYLGLVGHLRSQREDIVNGLTWTKVKSIVKKDDIDRDSDRLRKSKRARDHKDHDHQSSAPSKKQHGSYSKVCHNCGKKGHIASECRSKPKTAMPATKVPSKYGPSNGKYGTSADQSKPVVRCYKCGGPHYTNKCGLSRKVTAGAHSCINVPREYYQANIEEDVVAAVFVSDSSDKVPDDEIADQLRSRFGEDFATESSSEIAVEDDETAVYRAYPIASESARAIDEDDADDYDEDSFEGNSHWAASSAFDAYADEIAVYREFRMAEERLDDIEDALYPIKSRIVDKSHDVYAIGDAEKSDTLPRRWERYYLGGLFPVEEHPLKGVPVDHVVAKIVMLKQLKASRIPLDPYISDEDDDDDDHDDNDNNDDRDDNDNNDDHDDNDDNEDHDDNDDNDDHNDDDEDAEDDQHGMPKKLRAGADHWSKRHSRVDYDDDSDGEMIYTTSTSSNCEVRCYDHGWAVQGTSLRNHVIKNIKVDVNNTSYIGIAKVAFAAHRNSQNAVSLLDSGASKCMFKDRSMFDYLKSTDYGISTASSSLTVREAGPVKCIAEAYYLPSATHDLISIGDLDNLGCKVVIEGGMLTLSRNDEEIISIQKSNNVWTAYTAELLDGVLSTMSIEEKTNMWWLPRS